MIFTENCPAYREIYASQHEEELSAGKGAAYAEE